MVEMTRRQFLKRTAAVAVVAVVPKQLMVEELPQHVETLNSGTVRIYSGAMPKNANSINPGKLLCVIGDIKFKEIEDNIGFGIESIEPQSGDVTKTGEATHFVLESKNKQFNYLGNVGAYNCDLNMPSCCLPKGTKITIQKIRLGYGV